MSVFKISEIAGGASVVESLFSKERRGMRKRREGNIGEMGEKVARKEERKEKEKGERREI